MENVKHLGTLKQILRTVQPKCTYIVFLLSVLLFLMYMQIPAAPDHELATIEYTMNTKLENLIANSNFSLNQERNLIMKYLVYNSKCKIPSANPYDPEMLPYFKPKKYYKCRKNGLLTYITKKDNVVTLHIDIKNREYYSNGPIHCCYSNITRTKDVENAPSPDAVYDVSTCKEFKNKTTIYQNTILVQCLNRQSEIVYKNVHATVTIDEKIRLKMEASKHSKERPLSVLLIAIDSISRMNMIRSIPKTYNYLQKSDWIEFKGYNKIGDNTLPNVMGMLTGMNESTWKNKCDTKILGGLDQCNFIWYDYRRLGFVTGYGEDSANMGTFNFEKLGFKYEPTDYYFRPYFLAAEENLNVIEVDNLKYCTGLESSGERIFNLAIDFANNFKNYPSFGFFWTNSFSHNDINAVSRMDDKIVDFLGNINKTGILDNAIVIFISDHGFRFGNVTHTYSGWLEDRLPYFFMSIPNWFKQNHPKKYENVLKHVDKLTSPYDLYMTLQEILLISRKNYKIQPSSACPKCKSLFEEADDERSCADAGIQRHWCTCKGYFTIPSQSLLVKEAIKFILYEIHKAQVKSGSEYQNCIDFKMDSIISAGISKDNDTSLAYFLIAFKTNSDAVFQSTVSVNTSATVPMFQLEGSVSRLDYYKDHSWCVNDANLKKYCFCHGFVTYVLNSFRTFIRAII